MPFFSFKSPTGGGGSSFTRLCYVEYVMRDTEEIPTIETIDEGDDYSEFLSYDSSTKKFTVLAPFTAIITAWVEQDRNAGSHGQGAFYINNTRVLGEFTTPSSAAGSKAGDSDFYALQIGDTFWSYTTSSNGWPKQRLKVYKIEDLPVTDIKSFDDENI